MSHSPEPFGQPVDSHMLLKQLCAKLNELDTKHNKRENELDTKLNELAYSFRAAGKARKPRKGLKERRRLQKKKAVECCKSEWTDVADFEDLDNSGSNSAKSSVSAVLCADSGVVGGPCDLSANGLDSQPTVTWNHPTPWILEDELVDLQARVRAAEERAEVADELSKWKFKDEVEASNKRAKDAEGRAEAAEKKAEIAEELSKWKFKDDVEASNKRAKDAESRAKAAEKRAREEESRAEAAEKRAKDAESCAETANKRAEVAEELSKWKFKDEVEALRKRAKVAEEELARWKLKHDFEALRICVAVAEERAKVAEEKIKLIEQQAWVQSQESSTFVAVESCQPLETCMCGSVGECTMFDGMMPPSSAEPSGASTEVVCEGSPLVNSPETVGINLRFRGPPGLTSSKVQFCPFWKCGQCAQCVCGAECQFSQDPDLLNTIQRPQTWTAPELEMSSSESLRPLVYSVELHPVLAIAFVKFHSFDLCVSFASSPPEIISDMQVTVERCDKDASTVVIRFSGHHGDLDAKAIAKEVDVNLRAHSRIAFLHLA